MVGGVNVLAAKFRRKSAPNPRQPRAVALHAHLRCDPRHPPHPHPPLPAPNRRCGSEKNRSGSSDGPASSQRLQPGPRADDHPHHAGLRGQLRHRPSAHPAASADSVGPGRGQGRSSSRPGKGRARRPWRRQARAAPARASSSRSAATPTMRRWPTSRCGRIGGLLGRLLLALLGVRILSRRTLLRVFRTPAHLRAAAFLVDIHNALRRPIRCRTWSAAFYRRRVDRVAIQFLGQLHPAGLSPYTCAARARASRRTSAGGVIGTGAAWLTLPFSASTPPAPRKIAVVGAIVAGAYALIGTPHAIAAPNRSRKRWRSDTKPRPVVAVP